MLARLFSWFRFGGNDRDEPDFVPASAKVFDYQLQGLVRIAAQHGKPSIQTLAQQVASDPDSAFSPLQLLCSWKYINRQPLSPIEHYTLAIQGLPMEVNNGGFHQYFSNSAGDDWDIIAWGLRESGDHEASASFAQVLANFPQGRPSRNRTTRNRQLDALGEAQWTVFNSHDRQFYEKPFPDWPKVMTFIASRSGEFQFTWPDLPANPTR